MQIPRLLRLLANPLGMAADRSALLQSRGGFKKFYLTKELIIGIPESVITTNK
jgi:hypothetical protein